MSDERALDEQRYLAAARLLLELEQRVMLAIAAALGRGAVGTAEWKADRLARAGAISEAAAAIVSRYRAEVEAGLQDGISAAAVDEALRVDAVASAARAAGLGLPSVLRAVEDPAISATIDAWVVTATRELNLAMAALVEGARRAYVDTINRATLGVLVGTDSARAAVADACLEWARDGLPSITDRAGRTWTTEAYASAVVRSNVRRVTTAVAFERMDEYGADLIEVSSHAGARPLCAPYQGRILSRSGKTKGYQSLASTSYGEPAGLFGINCGHIAYPFWPGVSERRAEPDDSRANAEAYAESQRQRKYERAIRAAKREVAVMEALGDPAAVREARSLLRNRQSAMRDFIEESGRTRRRDREQVYE